MEVGELGGGEELLFNEYRVSVWEDKKVLGTKDDSTRAGMYLMLLNCIVKNGYNGNVYAIFS